MHSYYCIAGSFLRMKQFTLWNIRALKSSGGALLHWQCGSCVLISHTQYLSEEKSIISGVWCWTFGSVLCRLRMLFWQSHKMLCVLLELTSWLSLLNGWCLAVEGLQSDDATILECPILGKSLAAIIHQAQTPVLQLQGPVGAACFGSLRVADRAAQLSWEGVISPGGICSSVRSRNTTIFESILFLAYHS